MKTASPLLLPAGSVGPILGMGRKKVYALLRTGELGYVKLGNRYYVPWTALDALVARAIPTNTKEDSTV